MFTTARQPDSVGQILKEEFLGPLGLTQGDLADATGLPRKHINELCNNRRAVTVDTALILAEAFGTSEGFWLNLQIMCDRWDAKNDPLRASRIAKARPVKRRASETHA